MTCRIVTWAFGLAYAAALLVFVAGWFGILGAEPDPLSGIFLIPLGFPWALAYDFVPLPEPLAPAIGALAPLFNLLLLIWFCRRLHQRG